MISKIAGRVRGFFAGNYPENREDEQLIINMRGDLAVAQSLPELAELVRLGNSWQVAATTGIAALTALPTTTSGISLVNGEPAGGGGWTGVLVAWRSGLVVRRRGLDYQTVRSRTGTR